MVTTPSCASDIGSRFTKRWSHTRSAWEDGGKDKGKGLIKNMQKNEGKLQIRLNPKFTTKTTFFEILLFGASLRGRGKGKGKGVWGEGHRRGWKI